MFHSATLSHAFTQILIIITQADPTRQRDLETALFWGIRLTVVSTAINPFLYGLLARQYRMAYVYVFRLWLSKCCDFCVDPPLKDVFGECIDSPTHPGLHKDGLYSMYRSLQYVIFMSCNVVVLPRIILYCNDNWHVKDSVVYRIDQQSLVAKWLRLCVNS